MGTKNKLALLLTIFAYAILFCNSRCNKTGLHCANTVFNFELPVSAVPDADSILVGDSITLIINEPTSFKEISTGQIVDYRGATNLGSAIAFLQYDSSINSFVEAASLFSFSLLEGKRVQETNPALNREFLFAEKNDRYIFKLVVIPQKPGLYGIVLSNSGNTYRSSDPCTKAGFVINFHNTNHNRHLKGYTGEDLPGGDFYFHVGQ